MESGVRLSRTTYYNAFLYGLPDLGRARIVLYDDLKRVLVREVMKKFGNSPLARLVRGKTRWRVGYG